MTQPALGHVSSAAVPESKRQSFPAAPFPLHPHPCPTLASRSMIGPEIELLRQLSATQTVLLHQKGLVEGGRALPVPPEPLYR